MQPGSTKQPTDMKTLRKHEGVVVPMVTPVNGAGHIDEPAVERLVDHLLVGQVDGIFVLGTTGEGGAVLPAERDRSRARRGREG